MTVEVAEKSTSLILNVDDNEGARYAKSRTLKLAGFEVLEASTGADALEIVQRRMPDLVLLDMKLPDISGLEVCRRIKQDPNTSSVMVLQTSASLIDSGDRVRGLDEGADNYLAAPVEPIELIANVNALLRLREAQRALYDNEERFRQMAENIGDVFWIFDPQRLQMLYVSPAYEKIWGRTSERLYKNFYAWQESVHPEDRERVSIAFADLLKYQDYEQEYRLLMPDGSERWIRDRGFPVRNAAGNNYRITRISQDISAPKTADHALREAAIRKDEFLATLAHELRNPLAPMRTAIDLMRIADIGQVVTGSTEINAREIMSRQIDHLVRLVDDLLDVSRITQGKLLLQKGFIELRPIVDAALETNETFLRLRKHRLTVNMPTEKIWLNGDSVRLAQVVSNLIHNAAKYTPEGGDITLNIVTAGNHLQIMVSDNGIGVSREHIGRIFELFTQAQRLESKAPEGLGVGLSLVKRLVELHGGTIQAESPGPGKGSTFTIDLPINPKLPITEKTKPARKKPTHKNALRILLVDDSVDAVNLLKLLLESMGHQIEVANEGKTALILAAKLVPHVVLLDIGLPGKDGYEVARELKQMPELQQTILIALTGYGQEKDREQAFSSGFSYHFIKPLDIDELIKVLTDISPF
ncbi:MAG: hybrid sensor histidine kinase/response regulator [Verrucomicrobiaceae bacterium]|nr:hybrid sensor histidine kinase/response regulator [Verrucomicrobiaceae bacterium]